MLVSLLSIRSSLHRLKLSSPKSPERGCVKRNVNWEKIGKGLMIASVHLLLCDPHWADWNLGHMCACVGWEIEMEYYTLFLYVFDYVWCMSNSIRLITFSKLIFVWDVWSDPRSEYFGLYFPRTMSGLPSFILMRAAAQTGWPMAGGVRTDFVFVCRKGAFGQGKVHTNLLSFCVTDKA